MLLELHVVRTEPNLKKKITKGNTRIKKAFIWFDVTKIERKNMCGVCHTFGKQR